MEIGGIKRMRGGRAILLLLLGGFGAGVANGLLGAGGGILVVFALSRILKGEELEPRDLFANALSVMLPISAVSLVRYALRGHLPTQGFGLFVLPALVGGVIGGLLLGRVGGVRLKRLFGALVIWSGVLLIIR